MVDFSFWDAIVAPFSYRVPQKNVFFTDYKNKFVISLWHLVESYFNISLLVIMSHPLSHLKIEKYFLNLLYIVSISKILLRYT